MTFESILPLLKNGSMVRLNSWHPDAYIVKVKDVIRYHCLDICLDYWSPTVEAIFSSGWELYKNDD